MAYSKNYIATGSNSGIVNIYDINNSNRKINPKPLKEITNLTTSITDIRFNK